jgi:hypothetical protein
MSSHFSRKAENSSSKLLSPMIKFERLEKWCGDVNARQSRVAYNALYVKQEEYEANSAKNFDELIRLFLKKK